MQKTERSKTIVNTGTIGPAGHGNIILATAITTVLAKTYGGSIGALNPVDSTPEKKALGITVDTSHVRYQVSSRCYHHVKFPGDKYYTRNIIVSALQLDGAILVINVNVLKCMSQAREHILLARQV